MVSEIIKGKPKGKFLTWRIISHRNLFLPTKFSVSKTFFNRHSTSFDRQTKKTSLVKKPFFKKHTKTLDYQTKKHGRQKRFSKSIPFLSTGKLKKISPVKKPFFKKKKPLSTTKLKICRSSRPKIWKTSFSWRRFCRRHLTSFDQSEKHLFCQDASQRSHSSSQRQK